MYVKWIFAAFTAIFLLGLMACSKPVTPTPSITLDKAIAIAYENVPASVREQAALYVWWTPQISLHGAWQIEFHNTNITQTDLGWIPDPSGTPQVVLNNVSPDVPTTYKILVINIDGNTGEVMLKMASDTDGRLGDVPPPLTVVPPQKS